jgi:hypothetical protein
MESVNKMPATMENKIGVYSNLNIEGKLCIGQTCIDSSILAKLLQFLK